jgi:hypothetical protein
MTTVLFRFFCWFMGEPFWSCKIVYQFTPQAIQFYFYMVFS